MLHQLPGLGFESFLGTEIHRVTLGVIQKNSTEISVCFQGNAISV
jgi:hypothetical protein